jgi:glycosyltransferase involved in cell wall biosynthesis
MSEKRNHFPRTLFVGSFMPSAALERYPSADLATRLSALGWTTLLTARREGRFARLADMLWTLYRKRADFDLAVVDVFSGKAFFLAEAAVCLLNRLRKPFIAVLHGGNLPEFSAQWPGRVRRLLSSAKAVTTPSNYLKEQMREFASRIECLPNPIQVADHDFRLRRSPGTGLIWLRAFHEIYNPLLAVKALLDLLPNQPQARLTMVGLDKRDGSLERTQAFIRHHGLGQRVNILGPIEKKAVPAALQNADIFLNTSRIDNTPVSVLEAMANGLCVVSTNVGGMPFMLDNEKDSLLVGPDQSKEMAQAVNRLLAEPLLAERISRNARAKAEKWDWAQILPRWQSLLLGDQLSLSSGCCV